MKIYAFEFNVYSDGRQGIKATRQQETTTILKIS